MAAQHALPPICLSNTPERQPTPFPARATFFISAGRAH